MLVEYKSGYVKVVNYLMKEKMPPQGQANNLELCLEFKELEDLCPIALLLISQIILFIFIVAKHKGAQHGLKGQCVLVPTDGKFKRYYQGHVMMKTLFHLH